LGILISIDLLKIEKDHAAILMIQSSLIISSVIWVSLSYLSREEVTLGATCKILFLSKWTGSLPWWPGQITTHTPWSCPLPKSLLTTFPARSILALESPRQISSDLKISGSSILAVLIKSLMPGPLLLEVPIVHMLSVQNSNFSNEF